MRTPDDTSRFIQREIRLLVVLILAAITAFVGTRVAAEWDRRVTIQTAEAWYEVGTQRLRAGQVDGAVVAFGRASTRDRANRAYGTALARALDAAGRQDDARRVLLQLRESTPEDPSINIELARLEAARMDVTAAVRYYHSAIYGIWGNQPPAARQALQTELIRLLLAQGQRDSAEAELLALVPNLGADAAAHVDVGQLFVAADDPRRALDQFSRALEVAPNNREARAGAADAAFLAGDYTAARRYLRDLPNPLPRLVEQDALAALILASDPSRARLPISERRSRLLRALQHLIGRLDACRDVSPEGAATGSLAAARTRLQAFAAALTDGPWREAADQIDAGVDLLAELTPDIMRRCGTSSRTDAALLLIARPREESPR